MLLNSVGTSRVPSHQLRIKDVRNYDCLESNNARDDDVKGDMELIVQCKT